MSLQDNFKAFLHDIEPSRSTVDEIAGAHMALRSYLEGHDCYSQHPSVLSAMIRPSMKQSVLAALAASARGLRSSARRKAAAVDRKSVV